MNGKVIHTLLSLLNQGVAENLPRKFLRLAIDLLQGLINGYCANRNRTITDNPLPSFVDVFTGGQIHDRIATPADGPGHLFDLFLNARTQRGITDIRIDLNKKISPDDHRLRFRMVDVDGNNGTAPGHFVSHEFRGDMLRQKSTKIMAGMLAAQ